MTSPPIKSSLCGLTTPGRFLRSHEEVTKRRREKFRGIDVRACGLVGRALLDLHCGVDDQDRETGRRALGSRRVLGHNLEIGARAVDLIAVAVALGAL